MGKTKQIASIMTIGFFIVLFALAAVVVGFIVMMVIKALHFLFFWFMVGAVILICMGAFVWILVASFRRK